MDKVEVFPRKTHIHGKHYRCTFSAKGRGHLTIDFWNSYADEEKNAYNFGAAENLVTIRENPYWDKYRHGQPDRSTLTHTRSKRNRNTPTAYDVLASIQKYDVGTFHDFCGDFAYDEDSRKAEQTYQAVCKEYQKVRKFFTDAELAEAQEIS